jgi:hypothetical protein
MDTFYKTIVVNDGSLYQNIKNEIDELRKIDKIYKDIIYNLTSDQLYLLILTGNPLKYVNHLFDEFNKNISVRKFYNQLTNKSHSLLFMSCKSEMDRCNKCMDSVIKPVTKIASTYQCYCKKHMIEIASIANICSQKCGKLYFEKLYHLYYVFQYNELIYDIKYKIRELMFL